jgi:osmotically-inducible protein OsmY
VTEGKVFLTGSVKKPEDRIEAVKIAWRAGGVRSVVNEIQVEDESSLIDAARDRWISTKLRVKITLDKSIRAVNYNIDTVNGHIYLMGIAQNADELQRVLTYARATPHVRRIVSHVEPKDSRDRGTAEKEKPLQIGPFPPPETAGAPAAATAPAVTPVQRGGS